MMILLPRNATSIAASRRENEDHDTLGHVGIRPRRKDTGGADSGDPSQKPHIRCVEASDQIVVCGVTQSDVCGDWYGDAEHCCQRPDRDCYATRCLERSSRS